MALFGTKKKTETKKKAVKGAAGTTRRRARTMSLSEGSAHDIIRAPWFSEKALLGTEKGVYAFAVPARATKASVAGAIKEIYNVEPKKVRIVNLPAKKKSLRTRRGQGTRAARHKAYVYLHEGDTIQFA